jgi:hypothetical protein
MFAPQFANWDRLVRSCTPEVVARDIGNGYLDWHCPHCGLHALAVDIYIEDPHDHRCPTEWGAGCGKSYTVVKHGNSRTNL